MALTESAREKMTVCLAVLAIASVRAALQLRDIDLQIVNDSTSSPLGFIWLYLYPEMAAHDWVTGSAVFRFSLPMQLLLLIVKTTGASPEALIWPYGFMQVVFMLCSVAYLAHVLFERTTAVIAITAVIAVCPIAGVNFANFGAGIGNSSPVLYYSFANGFKFIALALFLRERWLAAAIAVALACYCHLTLGLFMAVFMAAAIFAGPSGLRQRKLWVGVLTFFLLMAPLAAAYLAYSTPTTGNINAGDWVLMSRLFNWHWHPIQLGLFGSLAAIGAFPFLVLLFAYVVARLRINAIGNDSDRKLVFGMVASAVLTIIGVLLSDMWYVPVVIKLAPQRASELITLIFLLYYVRYLVLLLEEGGIMDALLAGWSLALLLTGSTGLALLPLCIIAFRETVREHNRTATVVLGGAIVALSTLAVLESVASGFLRGFSNEQMAALRGLTASLWTPLQYLTPFGYQDFAVRGGRFISPMLGWLTVGAMLLAVLSAGLRRWSVKISKNAFVAGLATALVTMVAGVQHARWENWAALYRDQAAAFKDVQLWAARATPLYAVFLGDPAYANGWREYSRRAYFGSLSELAHFATLYDSAPARFEQGLARIREFGLDLRSVNRSDLRLPAGGVYGISVLAPRVSETFNRMSANEYIAVSRRYGVDYLIVERRNRQSVLTGLPQVYHNALYDVYQLPGHQSKPSG